MKILNCILGMALASAPAAAQIPERYDVINLADLLPTPGAASNALAVSHSGHVAGSYTDAGGRLRAVIWERVGFSTWRAIDLAQESAFTLSWSEARDVNDRGEVIGYVAASVLGQRQAIRWFRDSSGRWKHENAGDGEIRSINSDTEFPRNALNGTIAMHSWRAPSGTWPPAPIIGTANTINDSGMIAGVSRIGSGAAAFLSRSIQSPQQETLPGNLPSEAAAINQAGWIVGTVNGIGSKGHAAVWEPSGTKWKFVSVHPNGAVFSRANGINDLSQVVGWATLRTQRGFLYDGYERRTVDLGMRVSSPGWSVDQPFDINNAGEIVGVGQYGGVRRAFLLLPLRTYSIVQLDMQPNALNNRGQVAGIEAPGAATGAWVWDQSRLIRVGGTTTRLWHINDDYRMVGMLEDNSDGAVWTMTDPAGTRTWLSTVLGGPQSGRATASAISNANVAIGFSSFETLTWRVGESPSTAPIAPDNHILRGCPGLGKTGSQMFRINSGSFAAGVCIQDNGGTLQLYAASWSLRFGLELVDTGMGLSALSPARALNNSGVIVGFSQMSAPTPHKRPFVFDRRAGRGRVLPLLTGLTLDTDANAINSRGVIVGYSGSSSGPRAVRWNERGQIEDLNTLLSTADRAQWTLTNAIDINDAGQIVGLGLRTGGSNLTGFLLTPLQ